MLPSQVLLPSAGADAFPPLLRSLEESLSRLGVSGCGISCTALEDTLLST